MTAREDFLEDALSHVIRTAQNSRTRTKRLLWIEKRCQDALDGVPYNRDEFELPTMNAKSPCRYDEEIRELKREIKGYQEMGLVERIKFVFVGCVK